MAESHPELKTAEGGAWTTPEMIQRGIPLADLARRRRRFELVYWRDRFGGYHYPNPLARCSRNSRWNYRICSTERPVLLEGFVMVDRSDGNWVVSGGLNNLQAGCSQTTAANQPMFAPKPRTTVFFTPPAVVAKICLMFFELASISFLLRRHVGGYAGESTRCSKNCFNRT